MSPVLMITVPIMLSAAAVAATPAASIAPAGAHVVTESTFGDATSAEWDARTRFEADATVARFARGGAPRQPAAQAAIADLQWPLKPAADFDQYDYHGTLNFVDHDARFPGFVQDYTCGTRSYDLDSGYNHAGTDYYLWPFPWLMMDEGQISIVAAAPGVIAGKDDGHFDRQCFFDGSSQPNFVRIQQDDGLDAIYLHMRNGSVTALPLGARVAAGDYLGLVGSSGQSSGPHLHFELRDASGHVVDPRHGQCNAAPDLWAVTQLYEDPHIDSLSTHALEPEQAGCGFANGENFDDVPHYADTFAPGDDLWVFASYRDQRNGEITHYSILRPDGSAFAQWDFDLASQGFPRPFYSGTAWDWKFALPRTLPSGAWQVRAVFEGQTYTHAFAVAPAPASGDADAVRARAQNAADATRCRPQLGDALPYSCTPP